MARAQQAPSAAARPPTTILVNNLRIFDGIGDQVRPGNLLVEGQKIKQIASGTITAPPGSTIIDGRGRVLMPGLTDAY